jgi:hypothetical protein
MERQGHSHRWASIRRPGHCGFVRQSGATRFTPRPPPIDTLCDSVTTGVLETALMASAADCVADGAPNCSAISQLGRDAVTFITHPEGGDGMAA